MIDLLQEYLAVARGEKKAGLVLKNAQIVNVYSGEIILADLAIHRGKIIGWGDYQGQEELDLEEAYLLPGLIDAHLHLESTLITPDEFCRQVLSKGTTTIAVDPHELANVAGIEGIEFIRQYRDHLPLNLLIQLPSCVPVTPNEQSGATLTAEDLAPLIDLAGVHGLGEMMDFSGVISGNRDLLKKIELMAGRFCDGHAPLLEEKQLNSYIFPGIHADHESTDLKEALEKIRRGLYVMIREGSAAKDLETLLPLINRGNSRRFLFCTDDRHPVDLLKEGHMDFVLRKAMAKGLEPIEAIRMATLNAAECLGVQDVGSIAPGKRADLVVVDDLHAFNITHVFKDGNLVAYAGKCHFECAFRPEIQLRQTVRVGDLQHLNLKIPPGKTYRVIHAQSGQLLTKEVIQAVKIAPNGEIIEPDIAKMVVIERHRGTSTVGIGLVKGSGLRAGAFGSSVAHDSHNIVIIGRDDASIFAILERIIAEQGGLALAVNGRIQEILPLPIGGLISDRKIDWVVKRLAQLRQMALEQGVCWQDPFMMISFLALPVIPDLKLTTGGLFDVRQQRYTDLVVS